MGFPYSFIQVFDDPKMGFRGNIAAVILLDRSIGDEEMQMIANDLNQPATTFLWPADRSGTYHVRWFAPDGEIGLCGHGSLAAIAHLSTLLETTDDLVLNYRKGRISGNSEGDSICSIYIDPIHDEGEMEIPKVLQDGLGVPVKSFHKTNNKQIVVLKDEATLANMKPDFAKLRESDIFGYCVTAPGNNVDFVSRTLVPHVQQLEDHATGSSHAALTPFWAKRLDRSTMKAHQLSPRKGKFECEYDGKQVRLSGHHTLVATGRLSGIYDTIFN